MRLVEAFAKVFLVEPHGGDDAARRPIDHHISQQIIQRELPVRHHIHKISGYSNDNNGFAIKLPNVSRQLLAAVAHHSSIYSVSVLDEFYGQIWLKQNLVPHNAILQWSHMLLRMLTFWTCLHMICLMQRLHARGGWKGCGDDKYQHRLPSVLFYLPGQSSVLQVPEVMARPCGELLQNVGSQTHRRIVQTSTWGESRSQQWFDLWICWLKIKWLYVKITETYWWVDHERRYWSQSEGIWTFLTAADTQRGHPQGHTSILPWGVFTEHLYRVLEC